MLALLTLASVFAVQALAVAAAWGFRAREQAVRAQLPNLVSIAIGVLLGTALLHLLPEAVDALGNGRGVWLATGLTLLGLFALERGLLAATGAGGQRAQPCPGEEPAGRSLRPANLLLASGLHSFVDGAAIATAFAANPRLGLLTAFAVTLHEVPHRLGDVAVLLHFGLAASRALRYAVLVGVPALLGALVVLAVGAAHAGLFRWLVPISAGSFLYIAGVNLLPELEVPASPRATVLQLLCLCGGVLLGGLVSGRHVG